MLNRAITQGDHKDAAWSLVSGVFGAERAAEGKSVTGALERLAKSGMLSGGEEALVWFAHQIYNGDIQKHLANLDQDNRRLLIEVLAGFAGVE